jgi:PhzF family phenazine biosynthesis protein
MAQQIVHIDAFTSEPFAGNPAAVCLLPAPADDGWMQLVAREMNLSETAFLHGADGGFGLRWFTPAVEVDLCGHATLASAHFLWEEGHLSTGEKARFHTRSGLLTATRLDGGWIEMDFPATPPEPASPPDGLLEALDAEPVFVGKTRWDYLIELESAAAVRDLSPDFTVLRQIPVRGSIVTARSDTADFDFVSRFFAPAAGIDEDPVTGSSFSALGPYWQAKLGKDDLRVYQASARGGAAGVRPRGDRVLIAGQAVTVMRAELVAG